MITVILTKSSQNITLHVFVDWWVTRIGVKGTPIGNNVARIEWPRDR